MRNGLLLDHCIEPGGEVNAKILAKALGIDILDLRQAAPTQRHLKDLYAIICIVRPWTRTAADSWIWYCSKRLERFGDRTPAAMIHEDRRAELKDFLQAGEALVGPWSSTLPAHHMPKDVRIAAHG